jgi:hypothetical protein
VVFFRGREPDTSVWKRFRTAADGFTFSKEADYFVAHVVSNAERVTELFHALTAHLPPAIDVAVEDARTGKKWRGERLALPDVREQLARVKVALATYGGVEIATYTSEDQITLNPQLELFIYARTDQWLYILQGKGLEERRTVRTRSWRLKHHDYAPAPEVSEAIEHLASALSLAPA